MNITCCRHVYVGGGDPVVVGGGSWRPTGATRDVPLHVVARNPYAARKLITGRAKGPDRVYVYLVGVLRGGIDGGGVKRTNGDDDDDGGVLITE